MLLAKQESLLTGIGTEDDYHPQVVQKSHVQVFEKVLSVSTIQLTSGSGESLGEQPFPVYSDGVCIQFLDLHGVRSFLPPWFEAI
jgi:hypothetical protein